ncbi:hypothetical protein ACRRTK_010370 [Alexandromys fortis]
MHYNVWKDVCIRFTSSKALEVTSQPEVPTWQMLLYPPFPVPGHLAGSPMESPDETVKVESVWKTDFKGNNLSGRSAHAPPDVRMRWRVHTRSPPSAPGRSAMADAGGEVAAVPASGPADGVGNGAGATPAQPNHPLSRKLHKILETRLDNDKEMLEALKALSAFFVENSLRTRRNLRGDIERRSLAINEEFVSIFKEVKEELESINEDVQAMSSCCQDMTSRLQAAKEQTQDLIVKTTKLQAESQRLEIRAQVADAFLSKFQLTSDEMGLLRGTRGGPVTEDFFKALGKVKQIHNDVKVLLRTNQQTAGYTLDEFGTARRSTVVRGFIDALTRGGPGGTPRPIEMHSHDPLSGIVGNSAATLLTTIEEMHLLSKKIFFNSLSLHASKLMDKMCTVSASNLGTADMATFMVNSLYMMKTTLALFEFTDRRLEMLQFQIEAHLDTLINEQASYVLTRVGLSYIYNTVQQHKPEQGSLANLPNLDSVALKAAMAQFDRYLSAPDHLLMPQLNFLLSATVKEQIVKQSTELICRAYEEVHAAVMNPVNAYKDPESILHRSPEQVKTLLS